jgi:hypothetical protein
MARASNLRSTDSPIPGTPAPSRPCLTSIPDQPNDAAIPFAFPLDMGHARDCYGLYRVL